MPGWCNINGKCVTIPILLSIILMYEVKTLALLNFLNGNYPEKQDIRDVSHSCDRLVRLADYQQLPAVMLANYPGSGNTYVNAQFIIQIK